MIFGKTSSLMLKYQKAKSKLIEYEVPIKDYPDFPLDSRELSYPTTYILSRYSECIIENNLEELKELKLFLNSVAQYYDSAFNSKEDLGYSLDFLLSGASAYFLNNDFGSVKVLSGKIKTELSTRNPQILLINIYNYLLRGIKLPYLDEIDIFSKINNYFIDYFEKGRNIRPLFKNLKSYRKKIYQDNDIDEVFYVDILVAIVKIAYANSSWKLLPENSEISLENWSLYLTRSSSIKMLWPAQRLIAEKGILNGENAIIQLPTGVGKTKSIELIIAAAFLSGKTTIIIIAPLKALCNEITVDMHNSFENEAKVNLFSDVLQKDFDDLILDKQEKQIFICTPEKLSYILHHDPDFLKLIDLFIFDEGHMFDEGSRGVIYELLVAYIRKNKADNQQLILISAVLANSEEIKKWLFGDKGVLATSDKIISTPKSIGFSSSQKDIHFYSNNKSEEDFFIPRILDIQQLNKLSNERKDRYFPELDSTNDIAIYNAIKLCHNGGVAIYTSQQRFMKTIFKRILELNKRDYNLSCFKLTGEEKEIKKLKFFIENYYGEEHYYTKVAELGILPHSSILENGVKLAVEYAMKKKYVSCVICTSTLAQGINIPIKYLLITNPRISQEKIKMRDLRNLIGRTARSGIYTEGSVIITDSQVYDQRNSKKNNNLWNYYSEIFDSKVFEPCSSSILSLVRDYEISYNEIISGENFIKLIIPYLEKKDHFFNLFKNLTESDSEYSKKKKLLFEIFLRLDIISYIENYLCLIYSKKEATDIYLDTLAYALASEKEKELLKKIFLAIEENVKKYPLERLYKYSQTMSSIELSTKIENWIIENDIVEKNYSEEELLEKVINFYLTLDRIEKYKNNFYYICQLWINGNTPFEISKKTGIDISEIDNCCSKKISYELSLFIGNICDLIFIDKDDKAQLEKAKKIMLLQKKIKYGVPTVTSISICEKIFNDRLLAIEMSELLENKDIKADMIVYMIRHNKEKILRLLNYYPKYFEEKLKFILK